MLFWSSPLIKTVPRHPAQSELLCYLHLTQVQSCTVEHRAILNMVRGALNASAQHGRHMQSSLILHAFLLCRWFCQWLEESSKDFRVGAEALKELKYAVFGCGNSLYTDNFNKASHHARHLHTQRESFASNLLVKQHDT